MKQSYFYYDQRLWDYHNKAQFSQATLTANWVRLTDVTKHPKSRDACSERSPLARRTKITHFFWDTPLIFSNSHIKAWQTVLVLLFLTLPCPINLISEAFWFAVETGPGIRTGRSCQSVQLAHPGDYTVQITCVVFDVSCCKKIVRYFACGGAYLEPGNIWA